MPLLLLVSLAGFWFAAPLNLLGLGLMAAIYLLLLRPKKCLAFVDRAQVAKPPLALTETDGGFQPRAAPEQVG